jgi:hypothetical protein
MGRDTGPSNWGDFAPDNEIGAVNYLDSDAVMGPLRAVITKGRFRLGRRFPCSNLEPPFQSVASRSSGARSHAPQHEGNATSRSLPSPPTADIWTTFMGPRC